MGGYKWVFERLRNIEPVENAIAIILKEVFNEESKELSYLDVSGIALNEDSEYKFLALEFTDWEKWLGMDVHPETIST